MHGLLTGPGAKWVPAAGRVCEMHGCFLITAGVSVVFWIISWEEVNEVAKSFTYVMQNFTSESDF